MQMRLLIVCLIILVVSGVTAVFGAPPYSDDGLDWRGLLYVTLTLIFFVDVLWFLVWGIVIVSAWVKTGIWAWGF